MKTTIFKLGFLFVAVFFAVNVADANACNFARDLWVGSRGEDVRCLQQYLTASGHGFLIADGSYGPVTRQAVISWQGANGLFPSGTFDAPSRARYFEMGFGGVGGPGTVLGVSYDTFTISSGEQQARDIIREALLAIEDARDEAGNDSDLDNAEESMLASMRAFFIARNFSQSYSLALEALNRAEDVLGDDGDREDAADLIDEVEDDINDAEEEIDEAEDRGEDVDEANDTLDDARDTLDDAEDAFDDRDYDEALDLAEEADDLVEDALDEIGEDSTVTLQEARDAIEDAEDAIDDAENEIDDADDDGEDVDDAEELLEDAEDKLDDARNALNSGNYSRAKDLAEDAEELADDAVEELD
jgi:peptidoglycan hydrolase-like protein with peptidoglycan-binding domain